MEEIANKSKLFKITGLSFNKFNIKEFYSVVISSAFLCLAYYFILCSYIGLPSILTAITLSFFVKFMNASGNSIGQHKSWREGASYIILVVIIFIAVTYIGMHYVDRHF